MQQKNLSKRGSSILAAVVFSKLTFALPLSASQRQVSFDKFGQIFMFLPIKRADDG